MELQIGRHRLRLAGIPRFGQEPFMPTLLPLAYEPMVSWNFSGHLRNSIASYSYAWFMLRISSYPPAGMNAIWFVYFNFIARRSWKLKIRQEINAQHNNWKITHKFVVNNNIIIIHNAKFFRLIDTTFTLKSFVDKLLNSMWLHFTASLRKFVLYLPLNLR